MALTGALPWLLLLLLAGLVAWLIACEREKGREGSAARIRQARLWRVLDHAPVLLWTARPNGSLDYLNTTCVAFTGVSLAQLLDQGWLAQVHPDDRQLCVEAYTPALNQRASFRFQYRLRRDDGTYRWVIDQGVPFYGGDGRFEGFVGSTIDIHERKLAEDLLRESQAILEAKHREVQQLAGQLLTAHEDERRHLARELHDDLTQRLARIAIDAGLIERGQHADPNALGAIRRELVRMSEDVHALSYRLHPSILDDLGLVEALRTECSRVAHQAHLQVELNADEIPMGIDRDSSLCLFRIAQEALNNVAQHADAVSVKVALGREAQGVRLEVSDDGAGFDPQAPPSHPSLGMASMRERVRVLDGELDVHSAPGHGTTIIARVPA